MQACVRLFATYREQAGGDRFDVALPDPAVVSDAVAALLAAAPALPRAFTPHLVAVNEEFATLDYPLHDGDEVAMYPPVSGGVDARVVQERLNVAEVTDAVRRPSNGAVVTFEGTTRDSTNGRRVVSLEYETHARMAEKVLRQVLEETAARFGLSDAAALHRIGRVDIGETSLVVAAAAPHRTEAFLAVLYAVDRIKHVVPVWKKERFEDGEVWIGVACDPETHARHTAEAPYAAFLAERERPMHAAVG